MLLCICDWFVSEVYQEGEENINEEDECTYEELSDPSTVEDKIHKIWEVLDSDSIWIDFRQ